MMVGDRQLERAEILARVTSVVIMSVILLSCFDAG
jgi:hypothetical protein